METHHFQVPAAQTFGGAKTSENSLVSSAGSPMGKICFLPCFTLENWAANHPIEKENHP